jgi:GNAT superfamily N-acetyltransferase
VRRPQVISTTRHGDCHDVVMATDPVRVRLAVGESDRELADLLDDEIYAFNVANTGIDDGRMLTIRANDDSGSLVGGLSGWTWGDCGYVDVLWVREDRRGQGLGTRLLVAAHEEALLRGCSQMVLSTHSFQAPDFYLRHGYHEVGRTDGYPRGHAEIHLRKAFDA